MGKVFLSFAVMASLASPVAMADPFLLYENGKKYQAWSDGRKYQIFIDNQGQFFYYAPETRWVQRGNYLFPETLQRPVLADSSVANNILSIYAREYPNGQNIPSHFRQAQNYYRAINPAPPRFASAPAQPATDSEATAIRPAQHASALPNEPSQVAFVAHANREVFRSSKRFPIPLPALQAKDQPRVDALTQDLQRNPDDLSSDYSWCSLQFSAGGASTPQCPESKNANGPQVGCYSQVVTNLSAWQGTVRNASSTGIGRNVCHAAAMTRSSACAATLNAPQAKSMPLFCRLETNKYPFPGQTPAQVPPLGDFSGKPNRDFVAGQIIVEIPYAAGTYLPSGVQRLVNTYGLRVLFDDGRGAEGSTNHQTRVVALSVPPQAEKSFCESMLGLPGEVLACGPNISTQANNDGTNPNIYAQ